MDEPPSSAQYRPQRLVALCSAALAAAVFTPVPATADAAGLPLQQAAQLVPVASTVHTVVASNALADALISTGTVGLGLAMAGLIVVALRRRQW